MAITNWFDNVLSIDYWLILRFVIDLILSIGYWRMLRVGYWFVLSIGYWVLDIDWVLYWLLYRVLHGVLISSYIIVLSIEILHWLLVSSALKSSLLYSHKPGAITYLAIITVI